MFGYFFSILFGTLVLEDAALAAALVLISQHKMSLPLAFGACFLGIGLGDIGLYVLGFAAARWNLPGAQRLARLTKKWFLPDLSDSENFKTMSYSIVISRAIPGTRLPTYFGAGLLRYPFGRFFILTSLSVFTWVLIAFIGGRSIQLLLTRHWVLALVGVLVFFHAMKRILPNLIDPWNRKALRYSWRKWLHFEFWPPLLFYLPIVLDYVYLSIKYGSLICPFYANPDVLNGGLIGESKWDFLQFLKATEPSTLKTVKIPKGLAFADVQKILSREQINYPFILKPDIGQRGFGVRILHSDQDLSKYLQMSDFDLLVQEWSPYPFEAGIFYVRRPSEVHGRIYSITDKQFPFVVGDGVTRLGDLILRDQRARIIARVYFERHRDSLDAVLEMGQQYPLAACGNHCQGAIFRNGKNLATPLLEREIDRIAKTVPNFYFGRFDVRYLSQEDLRQGLHFSIVEINGAGSEATHIWDAETTVLRAYRDLFAQWDLLFSLGQEVQRLRGPTAKVNVPAFLVQSAKVFFRRDQLSVSS
jgi:membrane protein DedA with SNARE-associated domain